jgi:hypothetical protein
MGFCCDSPAALHNLKFIFHGLFISALYLSLTMVAPTIFCAPKAVSLGIEPHFPLPIFIFIQDISETWGDSANFTLGLGADLSINLLWGAVSATLVDFGNVPLITANQQYTVSSAPVSDLTFNLPSYSVSASSVSNGKISPSGSTTYYMGQSPTYTATPNGGYAPAGWYLNSSLVQNGGLSYTIANIQANDTITVNFASGGSGPTITGFGIGNITSSSATANAGVIPRGYATTVYFAYGANGTLNNITPSPPVSLPAVTNKIGIGPIPLTGLAQNTQYAAEVVASNSQGTTYSITSFTTPLAGSEPTITGFGIDSTNADSVTFNAGVIPNSQPTTTE